MRCGPVAGLDSCVDVRARVFSQSVTGVRVCVCVLLVYICALLPLNMRKSGVFIFFCESSLLRTNHSTLQRGMLHTAAEGGTATEGDREGGRGAGEGD